MEFRVICISHADGSLGEEVGRAVAADLGWRYVDEQLIAAAAREARVDPALVAAAEQKQSLMQKIMDSLAAMSDNLSPAVLAAGLGVTGMETSTSKRASRDDLRIMIRAAILEVAKAGDAVIGAHAASLALAGKPNVLRVLVTAPDSTRAARIARDRGVTDAEALDLLQQGDAGRREYLRAFYEIETELPTHYDLVLNTEVLSPTEVSRLIVTAAKG